MSSTRRGAPPRDTTAAAISPRQEAILRAALECYEELGWGATTIADIRARSGASTGSIYHHFGDKEGIAAALYAEALRRYRETLRERLDRTRTARSLVRALVLHHIEWSAANRTWARYLLEMRGTDAVKTVEADVRASTRVFLKDISTRLSRYVEAGEIVALPHVLYAPVIVGPAQDLVRHWLRGRVDVDILKVASPLADAAWRALRA